MEKHTDAGLADAKDNQTLPAMGGDTLKMWAIALASSCLSITVVLGIGYGAEKRLPPPIATVDIQKLVLEDQQHTLDAIGKTGDGLTDAGRERALKMTSEFAKRLSSAIDQLGGECKCVLVNKAALLTNGTADYTDLVRNKIQR